MDTRKALALLAYLLLTGEPQSRDSLAALLWPESDQSAARAALRRTLSTLRNALDDQLLDFGRETIALHTGADLWCDALAFRAALATCREHGHQDEQVCPACLEPLQKAVELYRGDFMAGFSLRDSLAFDDWQFFEGDHLRRELSSVLERMMICLAAQEDYPNAIEFAHRWLAQDRLNETAQRALIRLLSSNGQREAAMRQYRECVRILDEELGVPPLEETVQLYERVKKYQSIPLSGAEQTKLCIQTRPIQARTTALPATSEPTSKVQDFLLTGRSEEWSYLNEAYNKVRQDGMLVGLVGETGIGKTRLAEDFCAYLNENGAVTLVTRCYESESQLAYNPIIELLRQGIYQAGERAWQRDLNPHWLSSLNQLLPDQPADFQDFSLPAPLQGPGAQNRLYEGLCQVLTALLAGLAPGVVLIDNLEWADEASLEWLAYLARRLKGRPVFLLLSWRPEASVNVALIEQLLRDAMSQGHANRLILAPFSAADVSQLFRQVEDRVGPLPAVFKQNLEQDSGGSPLILVEYLRAIIHGEITSEAVMAQETIPRGLRTILETHLAGLSSTALQVLQTAAVIGRIFGIDLLVEISGRTEEEVIEGVEELLAHNLVEEIPLPGWQTVASVQYDFKHEQLRWLVQEEISLGRRRLLHRRAAEAIKAKARGPNAPAQSAAIAAHYQQAGKQDLAASHYFQAGVYARSIHANTEALAHFQAALALGYPEKVALLLELGDLEILRGHYQQAVQHLETAAAFSPPESLPTIEHKLGLVNLRRGYWDQAACHFEAALAELGSLATADGKALESRIRADWSLACHRSEQEERALQLAGEALALAQEGDDTLSLAQVHNLLGVLARAAGNPEQAVSDLERSLDFANQLDNPAAQIAALNNLALAQANLGAVQQGLETIQTAIQQCQVVGDRHLEAALLNNQADLLQSMGEPEQAIEVLKQAVAIFAEIGQQAEDWEPEIWKLVEW
jgi:DNA-binding SARP family transcriptional activator